MNQPPDSYQEISFHVARAIMHERRDHPKFIHDGYVKCDNGVTRTYFAAPWCARLVQIHANDQSFPLFAAIEACMEDEGLRGSIGAADRLGVVRELVEQHVVAAADAADRLGADEETVRRALMPHGRET